MLYVPSGRKSGFPLDCPKYQSQIDTFDYDPKKYPLFKKAKYIEFDQLPGEMLFIPTGWFHQVRIDLLTHLCEAKATLPRILGFLDYVYTACNLKSFFHLPIETD